MITELTQVVEQEASQCPMAQHLVSHPGVGPLTALAFVQAALATGRGDACGKLQGFP